MFVKLTPGIAKQAESPTNYVKYEKSPTNFDITFYNNHLDVDWNIRYDKVCKIQLTYELR